MSSSCRSASPNATNATSGAYRRFCPPLPTQACTKDATVLGLDDPGLPDDAYRGLADYQKTIDDVGFYEARVAAAKKEFRRRNTKSNAVFNAVRTSLDLMCSGARRCGYCEDSVADEVEH